MDMPQISIAGRPISNDEPPYVIAEISANHNGKIENAIRLIDEAKAAKADAVKIQTYRPDTITLDCDSEDFQISGGLWDGRTLFELYEEAHMPWEWHAPLFDHAHEVGITIFSSPFDTTAIDMLEDLNAPAYKIASFEAVDLPLIRYAAGTGKPLIISTGMASAEEIAEAVAAAREGGCNELAILHCVSGYPAKSEEYNLRTLLDMKRRLGCVVGLSDHTIDNVTALTSIALGASIIEKHVTLDRNGGGPDDSFSLEPKDLKNLCRDANIAWSALGEVDYGCKSSEIGNAKFRRSLYIVKDIFAGDELTPENVKSIRPGYGMAPKYIDQIMNLKVKIDVKAGTALTTDLIDINQPK